ncbi:MAG: GDP-mannose 4,6-dehydratase, partial [Phycisphaerales bacterium]
RPAEVDQLLGDASKARTVLGWEPKTGVEELSRMMVDHDLELARQEKTLLDAGHRTGSTHR